MLERQISPVFFNVRLGETIATIDVWAGGSSAASRFLIERIKHNR